MQTAPIKPIGPLIRAVGGLAVIALSGLRMLPVGTANSLLRPLLTLYPRIRTGQARRLEACFAASPFPPTLDLEAYYRARLRLFLRGLKIHGMTTPEISLGNEGICIEGESHYAKAVEAGRPVALVGVHSGLFELLHRVPRIPEAKPFLILTAEAFSPPLTRYMAEGRERDGKKILWVGGTRGRSLERGLRAVTAANGVIALMADQHPGGTGKIEYLRLWGRICVPYPARLLRFLMSRDFTLLPVSTWVDESDRVQFRFHPAWNENPGPEPSGAAIPPELSGKVRRFLEEAISAAPEQWNWSYPKIVPAAL